MECSSYICGIILESIADPGVLDAIRTLLIRERIEERPMEKELIWHVREYHIPAAQLDQVIRMLEASIKREWYIHLFNMAEGILYVVLHGKSFKLPLQRDEQWEPMIEYGLAVGVERKWTESVPIGRV